MKALFLTLAACLLTTQVHATLIGQLGIETQTASTINTADVVKVQLGVCTADPGASGCSSPYTVGSLSGTGGTVTLNSAFAGWTDITTKLRNPNNWLSVQYVWGNDPVTVAHVPSVLKVSNLSSAYFQNIPGTTTEVTTTSPSFGVYTSGSYTLDSITFALDLYRPTFPGYANPNEYWINIARIGQTSSPPSLVKFNGHLGAGSEVPEPGLLHLIGVSMFLAVVFGSLRLRKFWLR